MQHHLYKEPQDAIEPLEDIDYINQREMAKVAYPLSRIKEPRSEMRLTLIIALSFTAGLVTALLSAVFARLV